MGGEPEAVGPFLPFNSYKKKKKHESWGNIPVTAVAHMIHNFKIHGNAVNVPGCGRRRKIDDNLKIRKIRMVTKVPRTTSKGIKGER